jgi:hypothetical protein
MDTIENVVSHILDDNKPIEKPKRRKQYGNITQRQQLGDEDLTGLMTIGHLTQIIM